MKVKVQCPCGTRFEFEVEPVNQRMPVPIACPTCGADDTVLANAIIQQQSAAAVPASLTISKPRAAPSAAPVAEESTAPLCPRHKSEPAFETCCVCGKPICPKCMEQFGYVCSVYCRQQAALKRIYVPVFAGQKSVIAGKSEVLAKRLAFTVTALIVLAIGFWIWYANFARNPKVVFSIPIPKQDADSGKPARPDEYYDLIGPGQLLSVKDNHVSLFDVPEQKQLWSTPLPGDEKNDYFAEPQIIATTNDVWLAFPNLLARFDRQTGVRKDVAIPDQIQNVTMDDSAILVVSGTRDARETLTKITLPGGVLQTEDITAATPTNTVVPAKTNDNIRAAKTKTTKPVAPANKLALGQIARMAAQSAPPADSGDDSAPAYYDEEARPFIAAGANVVEFKTKLLEHKTIAHAAMKPKGKSVLDSENLTASQGLDVAQEMMNDSRREMTGGVEEEDVSRYQVTLHRRFVKDIPDWTGEVSGPPQFFALKTVDVLAAGQTIQVFDKQNKKLWDAKLTFSVGARYSNAHFPCLENGDALYLADLGMLTRYDLATGNVRWRYDSVGISGVQADARGAIYLDTTTAGPESITYSQQINVHEKIHPLLVKLEPESGKVLWRLESVGDHFLFSGKFLYATRVSTSYAALHLEQGPDTHYYLRLLSPSSGSQIWSFHQGNRSIIKTEVQKNWIMLHFSDEVMVLKFFSL